MYKVYKGSVTVAGAAAFGYTDIDPPDRDGYAHEIVAANLLFSNQGTNEADFIAGLSIKVPVRTTFTDAEVFDHDIIGVAHGPYRPDILTFPHITEEGIAMVTEPVFSDTLRIVAGTKDGVVDANGIIVYYRLEIEYRKLTDALRDLMNRRCYS